MVVENRTLELETFGIQFPKQLFLDFVQNGNEVLMRFSDPIIKGKNAILTDNWGTIDPAIQQVIQQITLQIRR
jgi:AraC family transcriptional activator of pyochelin receptor